MEGTKIKHTKYRTNVHKPSNLPCLIVGRITTAKEQSEHQLSIILLPNPRHGSATGTHDNMLRTKQSYSPTRRAFQPTRLSNRLLIYKEPNHAF